jgi:hypothetical protein
MPGETADYYKTQNTGQDHISPQPPSDSPADKPPQLLPSAIAVPAVTCPQSLHPLNFFFMRTTSKNNKFNFIFFGYPLTITGSNLGEQTKDVSLREGHVSSN